MAHISDVRGFVVNLDFPLHVADLKPSFSNNLLQATGVEYVKKNKKNNNKKECRV